MKLTELFTGEKQITDNGKIPQNTVKSDIVNRQIRSMVPGQTIQGEVVSKNGSEVTIRVSEDFVLQARLDQNMNLEIGKNMTFEVKNNGKALTLSPLFTNVATDANVLKALEMASLSVNDTTVSLTKQLMEAGLSIDRNSLQQMYREVNLFPQAQISDIVNLHKMQMPVTEANLSQMESYRNLTHQLVTGLNNVLDAIPEMFAHMMETGDTNGAAKLYEQLVLLAQEAPAEGGEALADQINNALVTTADGTINGEAVSQEVIPGEAGQENGTQGANLSGNAAQGAVLEDVLLAEIVLAEQAEKGNSAVGGAAGGYPSADLQEARQAQGAREGAAGGNTAVEGNIALQENENAAEQGIVQGQDNNTQQTANVFSLPTDLSESGLLAHISRIWQESGGDKEVLKPLLELVKKQWTITPQEVADSEKVDGLYRRLDRQLKSMAQTLENTGQTSSTVYRAITNLTQNLDFMNQMNQLYTYVQLPLRLQQGEAHGDLYVYTNKKHLAAKDGQISALLHLDMEYLGPVDVYVAMTNEKVNTHFYLQDDDMLDFIMEHIDILTERLQKRGYHCTFEMQVREQGEKKENVVQKLLQQESHVPLVEYAFDVRT